MDSTHMFFWQGFKVWVEAVPTFRMSLASNSFIPEHRFSEKYWSVGGIWPGSWTWELTRVGGGMY